MDQLLKFLGLGNLTGEQMEAMRPLMIIVAVLLLIALIILLDRIENARFRRWYNRNSMLDVPMKPWRTLVPWHREGSKWYEARTEGPMHYGVKNLTKRESSADMDRLYNKINKTTKVNVSYHYFKNK